MAPGAGRRPPGPVPGVRLSRDLGGAPGRGHEEPPGRPRRGERRPKARSSWSSRARPELCLSLCSSSCSAQSPAPLWQGEERNEARSPSKQRLGRALISPRRWKSGGGGGALRLFWDVLKYIGLCSGIVGPSGVLLAVWGEGGGKYFEVVRERRGAFFFSVVLGPSGGLFGQIGFFLGLSRVAQRVVVGLYEAVLDVRGNSRAFLGSPGAILEAS